MIGRPRTFRSPREILARRVEAEGPGGLLQLGLIAGGLALLLGLIFGGDRGVLRLFSVRAQIRELERDSLRLREENRLLEKELARLKAGGSGESLDLRAREVLGVIADGEHVYRFVEGEDKKP